MSFEKRFNNNWGLNSRKYLLIMYDDTWFWVFFTRKEANMCEELGINLHTLKSYHKYHSNKTMWIAFMGFVLENSIENDG